LKLPRWRPSLYIFRSEFSPARARNNWNIPLLLMSVQLSCQVPVLSSNSKQQPADEQRAVAVESVRKQLTISRTILLRMRFALCCIHATVLPLLCFAFALNTLLSFYTLTRLSIRGCSSKRTWPSYLYAKQHSDPYVSLHSLDAITSHPSAKIATAAHSATE
jgi:hypothetical protein